MRFFVPSESINGNKIVIGGGDAEHISYSLRCRVGERITVCDTCGNEYDCKIERITKDTVYLVYESVKKCDVEPDVRVHLFQALPKGEKAELIVQKAVELGVHDITFVLSERCVVRLDVKSTESKRLRYEKIAKNAAQQCGRGMVPQINNIVPYKQAVENLGDFCNIFCYEGKETTSLRELLKQRSCDDINLFVGPEGGWSRNEYELSLTRCKAANLGKRILRCETAPIFALSCIVYECEL